MVSFTSGRKILVTPDARASAWIEHSVLGVAEARGTLRFGRGNLLAAVVRALAEVQFSFAGAKSEAHVTAKLIDVLLKGLAQEEDQPTHSDKPFLEGKSSRAEQGAAVTALPPYSQP